ncbi:MAG: TetR family transcriptional regulator, partial [Chthonomonadales bacterium]|nr:TetR family transcriptional regulator [Chthonomonadales bacterium]
MNSKKTAQSEKRRREIIDGAFKIFAEKGFSGASNREIAAAAGLSSPALLYHYFKSKEDLLRAVVQEKLPALTATVDPKAFLQLPPHEGLVLFGREYLRLMDNADAMRFFRLSLAEAIHHPELNPLFNSFSTDALSLFLGLYFQHQIKIGALRSADPAMLTLCYC